MAEKRAQRRLAATAVTKEADCDVVWRPDNW